MNFIDSLIDTNQDGHAEYLRITPTISVQESGVYKMRGEIVGENGYGELYSRFIDKELALTAGSNQVHFDFNGEELFCNRDISSYRFYLNVADELYEDYLVNGYSYSDFNQPVAYFDEENSPGQARMLIASGDMQFSPTVAVKTPSTYDILASLYDDEGNYVDATEVTALPINNTAVVNIAFDEGKIAAHGYDGDYIMRAQVCDIAGSVVDKITLATSNASNNTLTFSPTSYYSTIPQSGTATVNAQALVKNGQGVVVPNAPVSYTISGAAGVTISGSTGVISIPASANSGNATITAVSGDMQASATLTLTKITSNLAYDINADGVFNQTDIDMIMNIYFKCTYEDVEVWQQAYIYDRAPDGEINTGDLVAFMDLLNTPVATSIVFEPDSYSATIPTSGFTTVTVKAVVKDQFGETMTALKPTYARHSTYTGVIVNSSTGVVTIQSTAAAGTATIRASYGSLTATAPLTLTSSSSTPTYTLAFDQTEYEIWVPEDDSVTVSATARKNGSIVVTTPELVSIVYSCGGISNTTGLFWDGDFPDWSNLVTATATFSNGTTAQATAWIHIGFIPPSATPDNTTELDMENELPQTEQFSAIMIQRMLAQHKI